MSSQFKLSLAFAAALVFASQQSAYSQDNGGQNNGDFLAGIFGQQVPTYQGQSNGGQTGNQSPDSSDELRLGIFQGDEGFGDTAEAEGRGGGGGLGGGGEESVE